MKNTTHNTAESEILRSTDNASSLVPEFLRLPKQGQCCPITGLSRASLNTLILGQSPKVKSVCLRRSGATRGVRLIVTASLLEYLRSLIGKDGGAK